jgi:subtilase family serine protease
MSATFHIGKLKLVQILQCLLLFFCIQNSEAQVNYAVPPPALPNVVKIEYYIDIDPGRGNGIPVAFTPNINLQDLVINIDPASLIAGIHRLGLRGMDANGTWSQDNCWIFVKPFSGSSLINPPPSSANIVAAEYYIDNDPGFGNANSITLTPGTTLANISFPIDPGPLQPGIHRVGVRGKDAHGVWAHDNYWVFYKPFVNPPPALPDIVQLEYYIDTDPGYGNATALVSTPSANLTDLLIPVDPTTLQPGIHRVGVRGRDANGAWSLDNYWVFYKPFVSAPTALPNIAYVEYYIDNDPGRGNATQVNINTGTDLSNLTIDINPALLNTGVHRIGIRGRDANGAWSLDNAWLFYKTNSGTGNFADPPRTLPDIAAIEYYIDNDPGYGNGTAVVFTAGTDLANLNINLDTAILTPGMHRIGVRTKDAYGGWSLDNVWLFYRPFAGGNTVAPPPAITNLVRVEYYIDTDPGYGNGIPLNYTPGTDISDLIININPASLTLGPHKLGVRGMDGKGAWGLDNAISFTVEPANGVQLTLGNVDSVLCAGDSMYLPYTVNVPLNAGNQFVAQLSNAAGSFASPVNIGTVTTQQSGILAAAIPANTSFGNNYRVRVVASSPVAVSNASTESLQINRIPTSGFGISGPNAVCLGTQTYTATNISPSDSVVYNWQVLSGGSVTANGATATVNWTGSGSHILQLVLSNSCGQSFVKQYLVSVTSGNLAAPGGLLPVNNAVDMDKPVHFSWASVPNAASYELFVWPAAGLPPASPTVSGITTISYAYDNPSLIYGQSYKWKVRAALNGCTSTESTVQQFTLRNVPDLLVQQINHPSSVFSETDLSFSWKIINQGNGATYSNWSERVLLCTTPVPNNVDDIHIGNYANFSALNPGQVYDAPTKTFRIPQGLQGTHYLVITTDAYNAMVESSETNNVKASLPINILLSPPADLQVTTLVVAPTNAFSEDSLTVNWTVTNRGGGATRTGNWYDQIYLSTNPVFNVNGSIALSGRSHNGILAPNAGYSSVQKIKLPVNISGTYYVHVVTDFYNQIYEYDKEDNNAGNSQALNIILRPAPNLVVTNVNVPYDTVAANQNINVQWVDRNIGSQSAIRGWHDRVFFSADTVFNTNQDIEVGIIEQPNPLASLSSAGMQTAVRVPNTIAEGKYFVFVTTDVFNKINEFPAENDNTSSPSGPVYVILPDLIPKTMQAPSTVASEQTITVNYVIKNMGRADLIDRSWHDKVYLSPDTLLNGNDILIGELRNSFFISSGGEANAQAQVVIPQAVSGNYYLLLATDNEFAIRESNENNNLRYLPVSITLSPWPDLEVNTVTVPILDTIGTQLIIDYSVKNTGAGAIINRPFVDRIFLSATNTLNNPNNQSLAVVNQYRTLNQGETYSNRTSVTLPVNILPGQYYIVVATDADNEVFENTGETNNRKLSNVVTLAPVPNIDLAVVSGTVNLANVNAGQAVQVVYTVKNNSTIGTLPTNWTDGIYLSANIIFDGNDRLLNSWDIAGGLQAGDTARYIRTVVIPNDASGTYYLLAVTDINNHQNDIIRQNNSRVLNSSAGGGGIIVTLPTPVDLQPISISAPAEAYAAQPIWVKYTVRNNGPGGSFAPNWRDDIFIAASATDLSGSSLISNNFPGNLTANSVYTDSAQVFLDNALFGNKWVTIRTDATDKQYEHNAELNNIASTPILIKPQLPSDLKVNSIAIPPSPQLAGQNITINWQLGNYGPNPANGFTREAVYLSADTVFNGSMDILLGTLDGTINILPQEIKNRQLTAPLNNTPLGQYYIIIRTDILNNIFETDEGNNTAISVLPFTIEVKQLLLNIPANDTLFNGRNLYYRIHIADSLARETMIVRLWGDTGRKAVNRLFLKHAGVPGANQFDYVSDIPFQANQQITVPAVLPGNYYLLALGKDTSAQQRQLVKLEARIIPFEISTVDARRGGNTGGVTIKITGAKFNPATRFSLTSGPSGTIVATQVYYVNAALAFATFNLQGKTIGRYNVVARQSNGDSARLVNGFEIVQGPGSFVGGGTAGGGTGFLCQVANIGFDELLESDLLHTSAVWIRTVIPITIAFENTSNVDIPAPTRFLVSLTGMPLGYTVPQLADRKTSLPIPFTEPGAPPQILRASAKGFVKVYTQALSGQPVEFILTE